MCRRPPQEESLALDLLPPPPQELSQNRESHRWVFNHYCIRRDNTTGAVLNTPKKWGCMDASMAILRAVPVHPELRKHCLAVHAFAMNSVRTSSIL